MPIKKPSPKDHLPLEKTLLCRQWLEWLKLCLEFNLASQCHLAANKMSTGFNNVQITVIIAVYYTKMDPKWFPSEQVLFVRQIVFSTIMWRNFLQTSQRYLMLTTWLTRLCIWTFTFNQCNSNKGLTTKKRLNFMSFLFLAMQEEHSWMGPWFNRYVFDWTAETNFEDRIKKKGARF